MMRRSMLVAVAGLVMSSATALSAQVVYNNGSPNAQNAYNYSASFTEYSDFSFASATSFDMVRYWTNSGSSTGPTSVDWAILTNSGGVPGSLIAGGTAGLSGVNQGSGCCGLNRSQQDFSVGSMNLGAGTYWLALHTTDGSDDFYWEDANPSGSSVYGDLYYDRGQFRQADEHAYQLSQSEEVAPEPATLVLVATGIAGVGMFTRRRRKSA